MITAAFTAIKSYLTGGIGNIITVIAGAGLLAALVALYLKSSDLDDANKKLDDALVAIGEWKGAVENRDLAIKQRDGEIQIWQKKYDKLLALRDQESRLLAEREQVISELQEEAIGLASDINKLRRKYADVESYLSQHIPASLLERLRQIGNENRETGPNTAAAKRTGSDY